MAWWIAVSKYSGMRLVSKMERAYLVIGFTMSIWLKSWSARVSNCWSVARPPMASSGDEPA